MKIKSLKKDEFRSRIQKLLVLLITFLVVCFFEIAAIAPQKYDLNVGDIAKSDIKAPRETIDEEASEEKLQAEIDKVDKQFTQKGEVKIQAENAIKDFLSAIISENTTQVVDVNEKVKALEEKTSIVLDAESYKLMLQISNDNLTNLQNKIIEIIDNVYEMNIQDGNSDSLEKAKKDAYTQIDALNYSTETLGVVKKIVSTQIKPNFFFDQEKTNEKIKEVEKNTEKIVIKKNQIIAKEGEPITEAQIQILKELGILNQDSSSKEFNSLYIIIALFVLILLFIENYYIAVNHKELYKDLKKLILINMLSIMTLILAIAVNFASPYLIPFACAPILITLLVNSRVSLIINIVNVIMLAPLLEFEPQIMILAIVNTILGATVIKKMQQRNDILYATIFIAIITGILSFTIECILSNNIKEILFDSLFVMVGGLFSGVLAIGILPFLEATFDVVTTLKLLELSNSNSPLLKRLLMEAPGTYHHSMMVANLSEMAADEVGANSVITRIGSYYHDVGKIARPYFFSENQLSKENPHNKINATLSTLIITSHVKDGVELSKEYKLPKVIQDIIMQHHGTSLVKYFYFTVKNNSENPDEVKEEDFRYLGPIPNTKEAGIVMLADSVEAAVRSISEPTKERIEKMVYDIIDDKLKTGQLEECDLTLKDLSKIRRCFLKALNGIYHQRIEYPTDKSKLELRRKI